MEKCVQKTQKRTQSNTHTRARLLFGIWDQHAAQEQFSRLLSEEVVEQLSKFTKHLKLTWVNELYFLDSSSVALLRSTSTHIKCDNKAPRDEVALKRSYYRFFREKIYFLHTVRQIKNANSKKSRLGELSHHENVDDIQIHMDFSWFMSNFIIKLFFHCQCQWSDHYNALI